MEAVNNLNAKQSAGIIIHRSVIRYRNNPEASGYNPAIANMSDKDINKQARKLALEQIPGRKLEKGATLLGLITASSLGAGATASRLALIDSPTVANKVGISLNTAKLWGGMILGAVAGFKLIDAATKRVPGLKDFREEHPVTTAVGTFAGGLGAGLAANPLIDAASAQIAKISANGKSIGASFSEGVTGIAEKLNASKFGQRLDKYLFQPTEKFLTETKFGRFVGAFGIPVAVGAVIARAAINIDKDHKTLRNIQKQLVTERAAARQQLNTNPFAPEGADSYTRIVKSNRIYVFPPAAEEKA